AAICFAIWPILIGRSGSPNTTSSTIWVMFFTILPMFFSALGQQKLYLPIKHIGLALLIGLINGLGMYFYTKIISTNQAGLYVSIVSACMPALALILGFLIMGQPTITMTKVLGMMVVIVGIWLIVK
ncbi:MAG: hypothetical protein ACD_80C00114G0005, partial [uncultured bacterium (gcode 4)]